MPEVLEFGRTDAHVRLAFREFAEQAAAEELSRAANAPGRGTGLLLAGIILLTYGRLEAANWILENLPSRDNRLFALTRVLDSLLPLPPELLGRRDPAAVGHWIAQHQNALRWDDAAGRFMTS